MVEENPNSCSNVISLYIEVNEDDTYLWKGVISRETKKL